MSTMTNVAGAVAAPVGTLGNDAAQCLGSYIASTLSTEKIEGEAAKAAQKQGSQQGQDHANDSAGEQTAHKKPKRLTRTKAAFPIMSIFAYTMAEGMANDDLTFGRDFKSELSIDEIRAEGNDWKQTAAIGLLPLFNKLGILASTSFLAVSAKGDASSVMSVFEKSANGLFFGAAVGAAVWSIPHLKKLPAKMKNFPEGFKRSKTDAPKKGEVPEAAPKPLKPRLRERAHKFGQDAVSMAKSIPHVPKAVLDETISIGRDIKDACVDLKDEIADLNRNKGKVAGHLKEGWHTLCDEFAEAQGAKAKGAVIGRKIWDQTYDSKAFLKAVQTMTTMGVFYKWLHHDFVNIMVFTPTGSEASAVALSGGALALMFRQKGGNIQNFTDSLMISDEDKKLALDDPDAFERKMIREAIAIDMAYIFCLDYFKEMNNIAMSTTWVYAGLQMGRTLARENISNSINRVKSGVKNLGIGAGVSVAVTRGLNAL